MSHTSTTESTHQSRERDEDATASATTSTRDDSSSPSTPSKEQPKKSHKMENFLAGTSATLTALSVIGSFLPNSLLKNIADSTGALIKLAQAQHQNSDLCKELLQEAIAYSDTIVMTCAEYANTGEESTTIFRRHVELLIDALNEAKTVCEALLSKNAGQKMLKTQENKDKIDACRRRVYAGLHHFQLHSNIAIEAKFRKMFKMLEDLLASKSAATTTPIPVGITISPTVTCTINGRDNARITNCGQIITTVYGGGAAPGPIAVQSAME